MGAFRKIKAIPSIISSYGYKHFNAHEISYNMDSLSVQTLKHIKRLTLFVHYNKRSAVSNSDWHYLDSLSQISDIIIISNSIICNEDRKRIGNNNWRLLERNNRGFDFGAWKDAIIKFRDVISEYDELLLVNNSCYFPAFPIQRVFQKMESLNIDFWGITAFKENPSIKSAEAKVLGLEGVPLHIQSYFVVFNLRNVEDCFFEFWEKYIERSSFSDTVRYGEIALTEYMIRHGKRYDVFVRETLDDRPYYNSPDISKHQPELLLALGSPLLKKKSLQLITIKQYYIVLSYLREVNIELYHEVSAINYPELIPNSYRIINSIVKASGVLKKYGI